MLLIRAVCLLGSTFCVVGTRSHAPRDLNSLREEVRAMFDHAYSSYLTYAYPYDELRSLSCDGFDTWGSFSLTLIDALDTLAVIGNYSEFRRVAEIIASRSDFEANINVSVFETNIRVVGGLLSAHLLSRRAGVELEPGWPCNGPLLRLAEDMAKRLIVAFDTPTGMPYGTVNLKYGVPEGETTITCTAGIGTFLLEFGTLSRLTGDPLYEEVAMNAAKALHHYKSKIGLVGNHIDVATGHWTAQDSGIGAGVDSYFEYLAKGTLLLQDPTLAALFREHKAAIEKYVRRGDWHLWVSMTKGQVTLPVFQSLDAYWPGVLSLFGDVTDAMKSLHNYHRVWKQFGFTPEFYNIPQAEAGTNREGYPLRPELVESVMYLHRATGDPYLIQVGVDILRSLQHSAWTTCGYATINDVRDHRKADRMESFFLAETTKYLYLLFDPDNFLHNNGQRGDVVETQWGRCVVDAGGYVFNTEAHPVDPGALHCCRRSESVFPEKRSMLRRFVVPREKRREDDVREDKLFHDDRKDDGEEDPVEVVELSQIRGAAEKRVEVGKDSAAAPPNAGNEEEEKRPLEEDEMSDSDNGTTVEREFEDATPAREMFGPEGSEGAEMFKVPVNSKENCSSGGEGNDTESSNESSYTKKARFDPQAMLENIRNQQLYHTNFTTEIDYQFLSCQAQPFLQRITIVGEFFEY